MPKFNFLNQSSEFIMTAFATGILLILFIPIPASLLDFLFIINFSWALTILLLTFYTDKPLSFSTFPALLLISTLFRLALNVSATRLILSDGDAGRVIAAIGQFVIHDNYVMGIVVFLILIIVQYVVVTNGAQRVAEVAARFTLDSMPGKQMSIDADLNMGLISAADAKFRRSQIEKEANFYGAMDGASKFVKGDAIAGVLIMLVDIIGGFAIGLAQKGMSLNESIHTYSLLTVGDGLVTQIPALTISMATGIIVTRAATDAHLGQEIGRQVASYPKSLILVCCSLFGLLFLKGIPVLPVVTVLLLFIIAAFLATRSQRALLDEDNATVHESLYDKIRIYPIEVHLNAELFRELSTKKDDFLVLIQQIRERLAMEMGFVVPEVKLRIEKKLNYPFYRICIQGNAHGFNQLHWGNVLVIAPHHNPPIALNGTKVHDPRYGLEAIWVDLSQENAAREAGLSVNDPLTVIGMHLNEIIENNLTELLTRAETETLLEQPTIRALRDELIPSLMPLSHVQKVLQQLLQENVSIRFLSSILEVLLEYSKGTTDPAQLTEFVRVRLAAPICQKLVANQAHLSVLTLSPLLEQSLNASLHNQQLALEPSLTERFISSLAVQVESMLSARKRPVLLCSSLLRRQIKQLTARIMPHLTVLGMNEIPVNIQIESFSVVT